MELNLDNLLDFAEKILKENVEGLVPANPEDIDARIAGLFDHEIHGIFGLPYKRRTKVFRFRKRRDNLISIISTGLKERSINNDIIFNDSIYLLGFGLILRVNDRINTIILTAKEEPIYWIKEARGMSARTLGELIYGQLWLYYGFFLRKPDALLRRAFYFSCLTFMSDSEHVLYGLKNQDFWRFDTHTIKNFVLALLRKRGMRAKLIELDGILADNFILTVSLDWDADFLAISISQN